MQIIKISLHGETGSHPVRIVAILRPIELVDTYNDILERHGANFRTLAKHQFTGPLAWFTARPDAH